MEMYILKSAACLAVLLLFYKLLLEKENMHVFKRFYLLISVVAAIAVPFITFTTYVEPASENLNPFIYSSEYSSEIPAKTINYWPYIFFGIYLLGVLFFSLKFFRNLRSLVFKIRINVKVRSHNFTNVLLPEEIHPHTFFSYIFFNKVKFLKDEIPHDVKIHEEAHARQKHSLDVLLVELLQIIFWFNPLIFFLKDAIKLNHEFLADRAVIRKGISTSGYQQTLLAYSSGDLQSDLVNPINYSSIKKRFTVMKTKTSKTAVWVRSLLVLPLLAILIYGFSTKEMVVKGDQQESVVTNRLLILEDINISIYKGGTIILGNKPVALKNLNDRLAKIAEGLSQEERNKIQRAEIKVESGVKMGLITDVKSVLMDLGISKINVYTAERSSLASENTGKQLRGSLKDLQLLNDDQDIASAEMVAEYNKLVKYYNSHTEQPPIIKKKDVDRINYIFSKMSPAQKAKAEKLNSKILPTLPPPPPPAPEAISAQNPPIPPAPTEASHPEKSDEGFLPPPPAPPKTSSIEKDNFYLVAQSPPPPNSNILEYVKELARRGANFYIGPHKYSLEEVIKMVEKSTKEISIDVSQYPDVLLGGC